MAKSNSLKKQRTTDDRGRQHIARQSDPGWFQFFFGTLRHPTLLVAAMLLGLMAGLTYSNSFESGFVLDNALIIEQSQHLSSSTWAEMKHNVRLIFTKNYWWPHWESDLYRPLTTLSYKLNYTVLGNGKNPFGYHAINLFLHWVNSLLVFGLVRRIMNRSWPALAVAALFVVHPINTEAVTNIVGRADLLSMLFVLGGLHLHIRSYDLSGARRAISLLGLTVLTGIGVFCKESSVVVLGLMAVYDLAAVPRAALPVMVASIYRRFLHTGLLNYLCVLPPLLLLAVVRHGFAWYSPVYGQIGIDNPIAMAEFWTGKMTAVKVVGYYIALFFWPATLSCDYSYNQIPLFGWTFSHEDDLHAWLGLLLVVGLVVATLVAFFRNKPLFFFLGFFFVSFLPTSNLIIPIGTIMGERLMYMPLVGIAGGLILVLTGLVDRLLEGRSVSSVRGAHLGLAALATVVVVALGARSWLRNPDWYTDVRLWTAAVEACPNSFKVHKGLATSITTIDPRAERVDEVIASAERGLAIIDAASLPVLETPGGIILDLGRYYATKGDKREREAGRSIPGRLSPGFEDYVKSLQFLKRCVEIDRAVNQASREFRLKQGWKAADIPDVGNHTVYQNLGKVELRLAHYKEAIEAFQYMRHLDPTKPNAYFLIAVAHVKAAQHGGGLNEVAVNLIQMLVLEQAQQNVPSPECEEAWSMLRQVYERLEPEPPGVVMSSGNPALNKKNKTAQKHLLDALYRLAKNLLDAKQDGNAMQIRDLAVDHYGCPREVFDDLFPAR